MPTSPFMADPRIYIPDGSPVSAALARITHLGIGAHQDDLEFHALHGILECWNRPDRWFGGITCTDGGGSSRSGPYAEFTDEAMRRVREAEQNGAALVGRYGVMIQFGYSSAAIRDPGNRRLRDDLLALLQAVRPQVVYTHNLADKHETHIAVTMNVLAAIRKLPPERRPARLLGFEGWRDLDWLPDEDKVRLDVSARPNLAASLAGIFDSQIAGGKRYDLAIEGRRAANASLDDPYRSDVSSRVAYAMDMTPLLLDDSLDPAAFALRLVKKLEEDVRRKVGRFGQLLSVD